MSELLFNSLEHTSQVNVLLSREILNREETEAQADELLLSRIQNEFIPMIGEGSNNAVTALFEELTAAGDLSVLHFEGEQSEVHRDTLARLLNGFFEEAPVWERRRKFAELCEELELYQVFLLIEAGQLPKDTIFMTVSNAPDDASNELEANNLGYRMGNRKGMVRSYHFEQDDTGGWVRVLEQISRSNSNDGSTRRWFNENANAVPLSATGALHETFLTTRSRMPDGVLSLQQELDGPDKLYGESWSDAAVNKRPSYERVREHSEQRRNELAKFSAELAQHEERLLRLLHNGEINYQEKLRLYYEKQDEIIDRIAIMDTSYARDARGEASVEFYRQAGFALYRGDMAAFNQNIFAVHKIRKLDPFAGGTACGGRGTSHSNVDAIDGIDSESLYEKSKSDADDWEWKDGTCVVPSCGRKGKVGPCSICKHCQIRFNSGDDPTKDAIPAKKPVKLKVEGLLGWMRMTATQK